MDVEEKRTILGHCFEAKGSTVLPVVPFAQIVEAEPDS